MTRQQKYPDTACFHFHNANPRGRYTSDCVPRAISTATGIPYSDVVREMAELQISSGYSASSNEGIDKFLSAHGWVKRKQPRKRDRTKYTGAEFCDIQRYGDFVDGVELADSIVANIGGGHIVAIRNGCIYDTWDSSDGCVGCYWIKRR